MPFRLLLARLVHLLVQLLVPLLVPFVFLQQAFQLLVLQQVD
ncbi:hypothetical protein CGSSpBS455_04808 [Streptococcus pneumoniae BS455]|nr:hypothetical protein CGSSpBS455_04808 [Streptococcus pneumoniae BS455]